MAPVAVIRNIQQQHTQQQHHQDLRPSSNGAFIQPIRSFDYLPYEQFRHDAGALDATAATAVVLPRGHGAADVCIQSSSGVLQTQQCADNALNTAASSGATALSSRTNLQQGSQGLPPPLPAAAAAAAATSAAAAPQPAASPTPLGHNTNGLPLPHAMPSYTSMYQAAYAESVYGSAMSFPLLTESARFQGDMLFANRQMRHSFIRKVLGLLTMQLLLVAALAIQVLAHKDVRRFLHRNPWVLFVSVVTGVTLLLVLACSESVTRRYPLNLLLLTALTLVQGAVIGIASATYATSIPVLVPLIAAAVCLALIAYALQTNVDFTASGGMLLSALFVLLVVSLADRFLGFNTLHLLIAGCGALVFCAFVVYDVQLLASGESAHALSADEYVFGAISVYADVVSLLLHIVRVLGRLLGGYEDLH